MPINKTEILNIVCMLAEEQQVKVTITGSVMGGVMVGTTTTIAGLLLGPFGFLVGV